jgi:hypothetical protein
MKKFLLLAFLYSFIGLQAQTSETPLSIYLDCQSCDETMIKQELKNVSFVRDQKDADVHLFFTIQENANGGGAYEIEFIGKNKYDKLHDTLFFDTNADMSELEVTNKILKYIRIGLLRFWVENGLADRVVISVKENQKNEKTDAKYPWNKWSFRIGVNGWFNGQETSKFYNINGSISGEQITDKNKFKFYAGLSQNKSTFIYGDNEIVSEKKSKYFNISDVISLNEHWSAGLFASMGNSVFNNYRYYLNIQPGVEYNFFPYSESAKKQMVLSYKIGGRFNNYYETTIFNKQEEFLWKQTALAGASFRKKWGSLSTNLEYSSYLYDLSLNELNIHINTNIRLFKGFSLNLYGLYGITHNQINLSAEGATLEEMLLQQRQIRSGYNYYGSIGINYSFGSIYNTVVNSRFDF